MTRSVDYNDSMFGVCLKIPYYRGPIEDWMVVMNGLFIAINLVSALVTVVANTVFLATYFKTPSLRTSPIFFFMLLAITDVSVGLVTQPLFIARKIMEIHREHNCVLSTVLRSTEYYFCAISFLTVTLVSIERYLAVCHPIEHRKKVTRSRKAIAAFTLWAISLVINISRFVFWELYRVFALLVSGIILVQFVLNAYLYTKIHQLVSKREFGSNELMRRNLPRQAELQKDIRLAKTAACLMVVMILNYLPAVIGIGYESLAGPDTAYLFGFEPLADTFLLLNSAFNPLFYCYRNKNIRKAVKRFIKGH